MKIHSKESFAPSPAESAARPFESSRRRSGLCLIAGFLNLLLTIGAHAGAGMLDTTFAGTGAKRMRFGFGDDVAHAVTVQPDGKVLVAGSSTDNFINGYGQSRISVVRYGTNGLLDLSFGTDGKVITPALTETNASSVAYAIQVQRDGKIVVAGSVFEGTNDWALLVRYNADGSLDNSFGQGGFVRNFFSQGAQGRALLIQPDGKIVLGGFAHHDFGSDYALARYDTNGVIDATFGSTGSIVDGVGISVNGLAIQADGKIIAVGWAGNYDWGVFRYTTGGLLDTTFGPDHTGRVLTHLGDFSTFSQAMCVAIEQGDGITTLDRIVVGGYTEFVDPQQFEVVRYKLDGTLDTTFGGTGLIILSVGSSFFNRANAIVVQGTGVEPRKIILAGTVYDAGFNSQFCVVRLNDNGTYDNSFDGDGKIYTSFTSHSDYAYGAALVPGGKLLVVGSTEINQNNSDYALARYNLSDGSPDNSFGPGGKATEDVGERLAQAKAVAVQPDGKILVAGAAENGISYGQVTSVALTRLNPDGTIDRSFGKFGKITTTFGERASAFNAVTVQSDGRIVAAGNAETNFLVARYMSNGVPDVSFNGNGIATARIENDGNIANAVAVQADGKIVIAGGTSFGLAFAILRFNTNGTLDSSFDGDGKVEIDFGARFNLAGAVKIQPDGKNVVGGYAGIGGTTAGFAVVRLNTNGVSDSSFGTFGATLTQFPSGIALANTMTMQTDGKIVMAGAVVVGSVVQFAVARYGTNGLLDPSFDGDGMVTTPMALVDDEANAIGVQSDGKILVAGKVRVVGHLEYGIVRYNTNGAIDTSFGSDGKAFVDFADGADNTLYALATDSNGRTIVAGDAAGFFGIARLQADPVLRLQSIARVSNGHAVLSGIGSPNQMYVIQGSTNLTPGGFQSLGQATADSLGAWQFNDAGAANLPKRFYRLALP